MTQLNEEITPMHTARETLHVSAPARHNRPEASPGMISATPPPLPSDHLLQGRKTVEISHNGSVYRLQATKLGKLILTK